MGVKGALGDHKKILLLSLGLLVVCVVIVLAMGSGLYNPASSLIPKETYTQADNVLEGGVDYQITIKTIYGNIDIDLYEDKAPKSVNSLLFLISKYYYNDLTFHRVIKNFLIQAGAVNGDLDSNPGYTIPIENIKNFNYYDVGMANASQFFIVPSSSDLTDLNSGENKGKFSLIGKVTAGFDVVDSISKVSVDEEYKPINDVSITSILITE
jgi:cyclophilin family peptidyl-prolyl cis-trans isomerase